MADPAFTVAIPTKNRPDRLANALQSVVAQTFADLEVVVCDNSDPAEAARTGEVVSGFGDSRIRYVRTTGALSMPDNWERALEEARGEWIGILTDRSVLRRDALGVAHRELEAHGVKLISWFSDRYGGGASGEEFKRRPTTFRRYELTSRQVLEYCAHGHPKFSPKVIPKLMTGLCHRSVLDEIRSSPVGRCCPPVSPDFTSGFLMLAHCERFLALDESLYVSVGSGNGWAFRSRKELAGRFRRDLGMDWEDMVDRMPSAACFSHAVVLNDLMRIRDAIPDRLTDLELDRRQYYLGCLNDYVKTSRHGIRRDEDLAILLEALGSEPDDVRDAVRATKTFVSATTPRVERLGATSRSAARAARKAARTPAPPRFRTVLDALAWDAANPRERFVGSCFLDLATGLDAMLDSAPRGVRRPTWARRLLGRVVAARR